MTTSTTVIPLRAIAADVDAHAALQGRCDGCDRNWYSAPGGQATKPYPHSRCLALQRDIPMVLDAKGYWLYSEKPADCPRLVKHPR